MFNARLSDSLVSSQKYPSTHVPAGVCCAQLADDASDADELDLERISDQHLVEQGLAAGVIVTVDESGDDGHPLRIEHLRVLPRRVAYVAAAADGSKAAGLDRESLGAGRARIHRVNLGVDDHHVGIGGAGCGCLRRRSAALRERNGKRIEGRRAGQAGNGRAGNVDELATCLLHARDSRTGRGVPSDFGLRIADCGSGWVTGRRARRGPPATGRSP